MTKRIIVNNGDGTVDIKDPAKRHLEVLTIEEIQAKDVPQGLSSRIVDVGVIPLDRTFRAAWTDDVEGDQLDIDMNRAREIQMDRIRKLRDVKMKTLDIETLKGVDVQAEKQILRDIPQKFDLMSAENAEELKILIPSELFF